MMSSSEQGTSAAYLLRWLARDHPEILDQIEQGELSTHAAAINAGIRKSPDPFRELCRWWQKADQDQDGEHRSVRAAAPGKGRRPARALEGSGPARRGSRSCVKLVVKI